MKGPFQQEKQQQHPFLCKRPPTPQKRTTPRTKRKAHEKSRSARNLIQREPIFWTLPVERTLPARTTTTSISMQKTTYTQKQQPHMSPVLWEVLWLPVLGCGLARAQRLVCCSYLGCPAASLRRAALPWPLRFVDPWYLEGARLGRCERSTGRVSVHERARKRAQQFRRSAPNSN